MSRYGSCEVFFSELKDQISGTCFWNEEDEGPVGEGWFYWCCFVGCLPEGDPIGPFKTEAEDIIDAKITGYIDEGDE